MGRFVEASMRGCAVRRASVPVLGPRSAAAPDMLGINKTVDAPLANLPYEELCPGAKALDEFLDEFR